MALPIYTHKVKTPDGTIKTQDNPWTADMYKAGLSPGFELLSSVLRGDSTGPTVNPYTRPVSMPSMPGMAGDTLSNPMGLAASATATANSPLRLRMPDGTEKSFGAIGADLDQALTAGGKPIRADGSLGNVSQFGGGWIADNKPLNVWLGQGWLPGQEDALRSAGLMTPLTVNAAGNTDQRITDLINAVLSTSQGGAATVSSQVTPQIQALLNAITGQMGGDAKFRNDLLQQLISGGIGKGTGLSPETMAALRTSAIEEVPARFADAESNLMTSLRRAGGRGSGLPSGGELLRGYAPLRAEEERTRADLLRDTVLADEAEKRRTGDRDIETALAVAGITDPARYGAQALGATSGLLNAINSTSATNLQGLQLASQLTGIGADMEPASFKNLLIASLLGAAGRPGGLADQGMNALIGLIPGMGGGKNEDGTPNGEGGIGSPSKIGGWLKTGGSAVLGAIKTGLGTAGKAVAGLMTNPITAAAAGVAVAGALWLKSQAHHEANTMVQNFENPFHYEYLAPFVSEFTAALQSGQLTKSDAMSLKSAFVENWDLYVSKAREYAKRGSDEKKVSDQSIANLWPTVKQIADSIDDAITALA